MICITLLLSYTGIGFHYLELPYHCSTISLIYISIYLYIRISEYDQKFVYQIMEPPPWPRRLGRPLTIPTGSRKFRGKFRPSESNPFHPNPMAKSVVNLFNHIKHIAKLFRGINSGLPMKKCNKINNLGHIDW